jgi:hypothetical protein
MRVRSWLLLFWLLRLKLLLLLLLVDVSQH